MFIKTGSVSKNRKARFNYTIIKTIEAGLVLTGSEVKSLRLGHANISESYAAAEKGALYLMNAHITTYKQSSFFKHNETAPRKLLLHKKEMKELLGSIARKGYTLIPLDLYFNEKGLAKVCLGIAIGKTHADKRQAQKEREWNRDKQRIMTFKNK